MKITQEQLRRIVKEELARLSERGGAFDFGFEPKGSERKIKAEPGAKWKKVNNDAGMVSTAAQRLKDAVLDQDEEAAAKWIQNMQKYAKLAYDALLSEGHAATVGEVRATVRKVLCQTRAPRATKKPRT